LGYEIKFKYFKKKAEGFGYDTEGEPEVLTVAVGKQWDEVELDEVAKACFGQMAKRNILIVDAEISEYTKKRVSFKLKDDGISIKNRKFSYDITGAINSSDESIPMAQPVMQDGQMLHPHQLIQQQLGVQPNQQLIPASTPDISNMPPEVQAEILQMRQNQSQVKSAPQERMRPILPPTGQPLRYEIYDPHPDLLRAAKQKQLPFTIGKRYPIYEEKPDRRGVLFGMLYLTEDDQGNRRALNDKHFVPSQNLTNDFGAEARPNHQARLAYDDNLVPVGNGNVMHLPDIFTLGNGRRR
jgi:hypothetical protein